MSNSTSVNRLVRALEQKAKNRQITQVTHNTRSTNEIVQQCGTTNTTKQQSAQQSDEQYQTSLLSKMRNRLAQLKANDNSQ
jgi:hypothetical protein